MCKHTSLIHARMTTQSKNYSYLELSIQYSIMFLKKQYIVSYKNSLIKGASVPKHHAMREDGEHAGDTMTVLGHTH